MSVRSDQERRETQKAEIVRDGGRTHAVDHAYEVIPPRTLFGRLKSIAVSNEGNSGNAYQTDYFYETDGQLSRVTGPGLPAYGATYNYLTNSSMLDRLDF